MADLDRSSLPERLAKALEEEIADGVWKDRLPGYRILCQKFKVSRPTCEAAFELLEKRGILAPAEPRRTRRIMPHPRGAGRTHRGHLLVVTDRMHFDDDDYQQFVTRYTRCWQRNGGEISHVEGDLGRSKRPDSQLRRWIRDAGADRLLLCIPSRFWLQAAQRTGLPSYSLGGDVVDVRGWISGNGFRLYEFLASLLKDAYQLGHRRILIPLSRMVGEQSFRKNLLSRTREKLRESNIDELLTLSVDAPQASIASDWHSWWPQVMARVQPSLVILREVSEALSFHSFCLGNGIRIPDDISMVVIDSTSHLGWLNPPPTQYDFPHKKAVRHFQSWLRRGCPAGDWKNFQAEFVGGETLGPGPVN